MDCCTQAFEKVSPSFELNAPPRVDFFFPGLARFLLLSSARLGSAGGLSHSCGIDEGADIFSSDNGGVGGDGTELPIL